MSKLVHDRLEHAEAARRMIDARREDIAEMLAVLYAPYLEDGEQMPDWDLVQTLQLRHVAAVAESLAEADDAYDRERDETLNATTQHTDHITEVRQELEEIRGVAKLAYGDEGVEALGLTAPLERDGDALVERARRVLRNLEHLGDIELRTRRLSVNLEQYEQALTRLKLELKASMGTIRRERGEDDDTLRARQRAIDVYDRAFTHEMRIMFETFQMLGEFALADDVRPSTRQLGRLMYPPIEGRDDSPEE